MHWLYEVLRCLGRGLWRLLKLIGWGIWVFIDALDRFLDLESAPAGPRIKRSANAVFTLGVIYTLWKAVGDMGRIASPRNLPAVCLVLFGRIWLSRLVGLLIRGFGILVENSEIVCSCEVEDGPSDSQDK